MRVMTNGDVITTIRREVVVCDNCNKRLNVSFSIGSLRYCHECYVAGIEVAR